jgi:hypothetical protein
MVGIPTSLVLLYLGYMAFLSMKYPAPSCDNTNLIFANHPYDSKVYKTELIRLLKESDEGRTKFWFDEYVDSSHIAVTIQNDSICAKGHVTVTRWDGFMKHLKEVQGQSYGGQLVGVKYSLIDDHDNPEIILSSVRDIID